MEHNPIYVYEADATDFSTTGLCGDLLPQEAYFEEEKNGISEVTMTLAYDQWGKWKAVQPGRYIKVAVPVRVPPQIADGDYESTVTRYEPTTTRVNVYAQPNGAQVLGSIIGTGVSLYGKSLASITGNFVPAQTHPLAPGETNVLTGKRLFGWYNKSSLRAIEEVAITPASYGMESITELVTRLTDQFFKITEVVQGDDAITVTAEHIFYELSTNYTSYHPAEDYEVSGSTCVNQILANTYSPETRFRISSSCSETQKGLNFDQKSVVEALLDPKNGACALYNMVMLRDNWDIYCLPESDVGYDRGFVVEYGKNMVSVERTENIEKLITRVIPWGKDASGNAKYPTNKFVDSEYIDDYATISVELLDTGIQIGKNGCTESNFDALVRAEAQKRFDDDKIDLPEVQMKIDFLSLGDTEEYRQFRGLDKVYLYDKITIKDTLRGYEYNAEVVAVKHNILTGQLEEVTLGSIVNGDGTRKIAVWQVPTISGENIRLKSIPLGALGDGSVGADALMTGAVSTIHLASATIDDLTTESLTAVQAQIEDLIAGHVTAEAIVAGAVTTDKLDAGAVTAEKIDAEAVTTDKIAAGAITADSAIIAQGAIGDAQINSAGINYAKVKDLNASSAYFGEAVFEDAIGGKLFVPRLLFNTAQGRQMIVNDIIVGASNGLYYSLDITETDGVISMSPTQVSVTSGEASQGHTTDGKPIIATSATYDELATDDLYAIDALIDTINAKRINVDELWAREAFVNKLMVQDISSNTYIQSTVGSWSASHTNTLTDEIAGINRTIGQLGRGQIFYSTTEPVNPATGDLWIKPTNRLTHADLSNYTHEELAEFRHMDLGKPPEQYVYNGTGWEMVIDSSMYTVLQTQIEQTDEKIALKASQADLTMTNDRVNEAEAQIEINATGISNEVVARQSGDAAAQTYADGVAATAEANAKAASIQKTSTYQTAADIVTTAESYADTKDSTTLNTAKAYAESVADAAEAAAKDASILRTAQYTSAAAIVNVAESYADTKASAAESNAKNASIARTSSYQTATDIVNAAKQYTNGQLTGYSTVSQTSSAISAEVTKITNGTTSVGKLVSSKVTVDGNGVNISTGGTFDVNSQNFTVNSAGNYVRIRGDLQDLDGHSLLNDHQIIISKTRPTAEFQVDGAIWIQPTGQLSLTYEANKTFSESNYVHGSSTSLVCTGTPAASSTGNYTYTLTIPTYAYTSWGNTTFTLTLSNGSNTLTTSVLMSEAKPQYASTTTLTFSSSAIWLASRTPITLTISLSQNREIVRFNTGKIQLKCTAVGQGTHNWVAANVYSWVN